MFTIFTPWSVLRHSSNWQVWLATGQQQSVGDTWRVPNSVSTKWNKSTGSFPQGTPNSLNSRWWDKKKKKNRNFYQHNVQVRLRTFPHRSSGVLYLPAYRVQASPFPRNVRAFCVRASDGSVQLELSPTQAPPPVRFAEAPSSAEAQTSLVDDAGCTADSPESAKTPVSTKSIITATLGDFPGETEYRMDVISRLFLLWLRYVCRFFFFLRFFVSRRVEQIMIFLGGCISAVIMFIFWTFRKVKGDCV